MYIATTPTNVHSAAHVAVFYNASLHHLFCTFVQMLVHVVL